MFDLEIILTISSIIIPGIQIYRLYKKGKLFSKKSIGYALFYEPFLIYDFIKWLWNKSKIYKQVRNNKIEMVRNSKNFLCMQNLRNLERYKKLYSVHLFKPSGRRHYTFYFCSLKCYNMIRPSVAYLYQLYKGSTT